METLLSLVDFGTLRTYQVYKQVLLAEDGEWSLD